MPSNTKKRVSAPEQNPKERIANGKLSPANQLDEILRAAYRRHVRGPMMKIAVREGLEN